MCQSQREDVSSSHVALLFVYVYVWPDIRPRTKPSGTFGNSKIDGLNFARLEEKMIRTGKKKVPSGIKSLFGPDGPDGRRFFFLLVILNLFCPYTLVLEMYFLHRSQRRVFARSWRPRKTTDRNVIVRRVALHIVERRKM